MIWTAKRTGVNLRIQSMGKALQVVAIADSDADANAYMQRHADAATVATFGPLVFLANKYDKGEAIRD